MSRARKGSSQPLVPPQAGGRGRTTGAGRGRAAPRGALNWISRAGSPAAEALPEFDPASLPPIESLTAESDIAAFLRPQVPAALRTAALRRVWTLDPAIRDYVGPADYAWDYNAPDGMAGFSLELGGDVKRLLAQAIGLVEEDEEKAPVGTVVAELPEAAPPPLSAPVAAPAAELERGPDPAAQPDSPIGSSLIRLWQPRPAGTAAPARSDGGAPAGCVRVRGLLEKCRTLRN